MPTSTLESLPADLLRHILQFADVPTLSALRASSCALRRAAEDDALWHLLVRRRFRVSARAARSRRLVAAGGVCWRVLHEQWSAHCRMPTSRLTGTAHAVFGGGEAGGGVVWVTVVSADDCRLVGGKLRVRVTVQNVEGGGKLRLHMGKACFSLTDDEVIAVKELGASYGVLAEEGVVRKREGAARRARPVGAASDDEPPFSTQPRTASPAMPSPRAYSAQLVNCATARVPRMEQGSEGKAEKEGEHCVLCKDDFVVLTVEVTMPRAMFEVDALERLESFQLPVSRGNDSVQLVARFSDRAIWENYERLPGGWWVRAVPTAGQL